MSDRAQREPDERDQLRSSGGSTSSPRRSARSASSARSTPSPASRSTSGRWASGPGKIAKVRAYGEIGAADRHPASAVTRSATGCCCRCSLTFEVDLQVETHRFEAELLVPLTLTAVALQRRPDLHRGHAAARRARSRSSCRPRGCARRCSSGWSAIEGELKRFVARYVAARAGQAARPGGAPRSTSRGPSTGLGLDRSDAAPRRGWRARPTSTTSSSARSSTTRRRFVGDPRALNRAGRSGLIHRQNRTNRPRLDDEAPTGSRPSLDRSRGPA